MIELYQSDSINEIINIDQLGDTIDAIECIPSDDPQVLLFLTGISKVEFAESVPELPVEEQNALIKSLIDHPAINQNILEKIQLWDILRLPEKKKLLNRVYDALIVPRSELHHQARQWTESNVFSNLFDGVNEHTIRDTLGELFKYSPILEALKPLFEKNTKPFFSSSTGPAVLTPNRLKTAALVYDQVWSPTNLLVPPEIRFFAATAAEKSPNGLAVALEMIMNEYPALLDSSNLVYSGYNADESLPTAKKQNLLNYRRLSAVTKISEGCYSTHGLLVEPMMSVSEQDKPSSAVGPKVDVVQAILSNLNIVDEKSLKWDQVIEFRHDADSIKKLRKLFRWVDQELTQHSPEFVEDMLAMRIHEYEWALKKHGIATVTGVLSSILSSKTIALLGGAASVGSLIGIPSAALFAGAGIMIGKVIVGLKDNYISAQDLHEQHADIAFISDIKNLGHNNE